MCPIVRKRVLDDLKHGRIQIATSCGVLTEGFDEPSINAIVMARPTRSKPLYIQCCGRGLRLWPGKQDCIVLDFCDRYHNLDALMTLHSTIPEAVQIEEKERAEADQAKEIDHRPKVTILENSDKSFDVLGAARFLWVRVEDEWSLQDDERHEIVLSPSGNGYIGHLYYPDGESHQIIDTPLPLEYASGCAEDYARRNLKVAFADASKPWMLGDAQGTQGQIDFLMKNNAYKTGMTRGQASLKIREIIAFRNKQRRLLAKEPITEKQKYLLINNGIDPSKLNKLSAMQMISKIKQTGYSYGRR